MAGDEYSGSHGVLIPDNLRETIQSIKKVAAKYSDEDIYGMLKECNMDPDETTQKLLYIDTFQVVQSKRKSQKGARGDNQNHSSEKSNGGRKSYKTSAPPKESSKSSAPRKESSKSSAPRKDSSKSSAVARVSHKLPSQSTKVNGKVNGVNADKDMKPRKTSSPADVIKRETTKNQDVSHALVSESVDLPSVNKLPQVNTALKEVSLDPCSKNGTQKVDVKPHRSTRRQSVIFPDHFHVPEDLKNALTFGSFDQSSDSTDPKASPMPQSSPPTSKQIDYPDQPSEALLNPTSSEEHIFSAGRSQDSLSYYASNVQEHENLSTHFDTQGKSSLLTTDTTRGVSQISLSQGESLLPSTSANLSNPTPQTFHYPPNYFPYSHYYPHYYMSQPNNIYMPPPNAASALGPEFPSYKMGDMKTDFEILAELKEKNVHLNLQPQGQAIASPPAQVSHNSFPSLGSYPLPRLLSLPQRQMNGTGNF